MAAMGKLLSQALEKIDNAQYKPFLKDVGSAFAQMFKTFPYPDATDWTGLWLAFDEKCHPYFEGVRQAVKTAETHACSVKLNESLVAAVEKQWPGKGLVAKTPGAFSLDIDALVDFYGAEAGVKPEDKEAKELENAKKRIASLLGSGKLSCTMARNGNLRTTRLAADGVKPAAVAKPTGEARVAAALPEASAGRPAAVFYLSPYALVRDAVLPIMAKTADKKDAQQYNAMIQAMPPAEANSALAGACWVESSGAFRSLLRVTAGEMKNLGAAFNAFTAASMASAVDNE